MAMVNWLDYKLLQGDYFFIVNKYDNTNKRIEISYYSSIIKT